MRSHFVLLNYYFFAFRVVFTLIYNQTFALEQVKEAVQIFKNEQEILSLRQEVIRNLTSTYFTGEYRICVDNSFPSSVHIVSMHIKR